MTADAAPSTRSTTPGARCPCRLVDDDPISWRGGGNTPGPERLDVVLTPAPA